MRPSPTWSRYHRNSVSNDAVISTFTVIFDANVFFGTTLRSLVMELSKTGLFRARWTQGIHDEWIGAVRNKYPDVAVDRLRQASAQMDRAVQNCRVTGYEGIIPSLSLPDPDDRHVLAAAIVGHAECIVTFNEKDFPVEVLTPYQIHTCHPDKFLMDVEGLDDGILIDAARADLRHYRRPPLSVDEYADRLRRAGVPNTADYLLRMRVLLDS